MIANIFSLYLNELFREYRLWWSYRTSSIISIFTYIFVFIILNTIFSSLADDHNQVYNETNYINLLLGLATWKLCMFIVNDLPSFVEQESRLGTLENILYLQPSLIQVFLTRAFATSTKYFVEVSISSICLIIFYQISINVNIGNIFQVFIILLIVFLGSCGFGLALAGLTFTYKSVSSISALISRLTLFIIGALVPINSLGLLFEVIKFAFPSAWGLDIVRNIVNSNIPASTQEIAGLVIQSSIFLCIGWFVFLQGMKKASENGDLGTY